MKNLQTTITLNNLRFYAYHGALPQERRVGGHYTVSVALDVVETGAAVLADDLAATVNYADIAEEIKGVMARPADLLEHVAGSILQTIFLRHHNVRHATVSVSKDTPPIGLDLSGATVTLSADNPWAEPVRLLIYDFDGTLADTADGIVSTMYATFNTLGLSPLPSADAVKQTIGLQLRDGIKQLLPPSTPAEVVDRAFTTYRELFPSVGTKGVKAFPGVVETLRLLSETKRVEIAIATSRGHDSVVELCEAIGIAPYVSIYVAEDDVKNKKPHPETVHAVLCKAVTPVNEAVVIGDTSFDIAMGRAAGCRCVGVTYGNHSARQLAAAGANAVTGNFADLRFLV